MKRLLLLVLILSLTAVVACGDDDDDDDDDMTTDMVDEVEEDVDDDMMVDTGDDMDDTGDDTGDMDDTGDDTDVADMDDADMNTNPPPTLGTQVDRAGRPAISTALIAPLPGTENQGMIKDNYNAAPRADWGDFAMNIGGALGVYDSLDGVCGNQLGFDEEDGYTPLAGILTADRLFVDSSSGTCEAYLGHEVAILSGTANGDCGGRTLDYDVIDASYTALTNNPLDNPTLVSDGVDADGDGDIHDGTTFPFLAAPL